MLDTKMKSSIIFLVFLIYIHSQIDEPLHDLHLILNCSIHQWSASCYAIRCIYQDPSVYLILTHHAL